MKKHMYLLGLIIALLLSGCSNKETGQTQVNQVLEQETDEDRETNSNPETDEEEQELIIPASICKISGMTAEEQVESDNNNEDMLYYYFNRAVANEDGSMSYFLTETQRKRYVKREERYIEKHIEEAYQKEDIKVETSDEYKEIKFVMGEESNSDGFMVTAIKILSQVGVWQILDGCEPEEWGVHFVVEREGKVILDVMEPEDEWKLTNEDFGE